MSAGTNGTNVALDTTDFDALAAEVREAHAAVGAAIQLGPPHALRAGELLAEAKARLPHGTWLSFVTDQCGVTLPTAQGYMRLWLLVEKNARWFAAERPVLTVVGGGVGYTVTWNQQAHLRRAALARRGRRSDFAATVDALTAVLVVGDWLGLVPGVDCHLDKPGDAQVTHTAGGVMLQAVLRRAATYDVERLRADIGVLVVRDVEAFSVPVIAGWIERDDFRRLAVQGEDDEGHVRFAVALRHMQPATTLPARLGLVVAYGRREYAALAPGDGR